MAGWAKRVEAHRVVYAIGALAALVALGVPFFSMRQGTADYSTDPTSTTTTTYRGYEMLVQGFGPGFSGPLQLVAAVSGPADQAAFAHVVTAAAHTPGVAATAGPQLLPAGPGHPAVEVANVYPAGSPQDASTAALIGTMRGTVIPGALHASGSHLDVLVGGQTALATDFAGQLSAKLPLFVVMVVALSFVLLMILFRSLVIPATAAIMNLFSAAAAFGVIVAVFQFGWLDKLVGVTHTGPITPLVPILMFAVLFGLSMDYEVFLVSRMHEEWLKLRDNDAAVRIGQAITGKTISAAAAIMIVVFSSFVITTDRTDQDDRPGHGRRDPHRRPAHPHRAGPGGHAHLRQVQLGPARLPGPAAAPPQPRSQRAARADAGGQAPPPGRGAVGHAAEARPRPGPLAAIRGEATTPAPAPAGRRPKHHGPFRRKIFYFPNGPWCVSSARQAASGAGDDSVCAIAGRANRGRREQARLPRWRDGGTPALPGPDRACGTPPAGRGGPGPGAGPPPGAATGMPPIAPAAPGR